MDATVSKIIFFYVDMSFVHDSNAPHACWMWDPARLFYRVEFSVFAFVCYPTMDCIITVSMDGINTSVSTIDMHLLLQCFPFFFIINRWCMAWMACAVFCFINP
eukprot:782438_1